VEVFVAEVRGDVVRLSIRAPRSVPILRREVRDAVREANREAAAADLDGLDILPALSPDETEPPGEKKRLSISR